MWCGCTSVSMLSCAQPHPRRVTRQRRPITRDSLQFPPSPTAAALGEHRAYCSGEPVLEADIADQRSSKLAVGAFASTGWSFDVVVPSGTAVEGACVLTLAAVAATASRATATNPVIVRCFVIRTSCGGPPLAWVMGILRRFNRDATIMDCVNSQIRERSCSKFRWPLRPASGRESVNPERPPTSALLRKPDSGRISCEFSKVPPLTDIQFQFVACGDFG